MSPLRIINVTSDIICITFLLVIAGYIFLHRQWSDKKMKYYFFICLGNILMILGDIPNWCCEGFRHWTFPMLLWTGCLVQFLAGAVIPIIYSKFLCEYMKVSAQKKIMRIVYAVGLIEILADLLNLKFGFFYYIDEANVYHRGEYWLCSQALVAIIGIIDIAILLNLRKHMRKGIFYASLFYVFIPIAAIVVQSFIYGIATTYIGITIAIYFIFFNVQSDQLYLLNQRERELQDNHISIMMSQIQPHFLYNSIAAIQALCEENPEKAKAALGDFSFFLRGNMDSLKSTEPIPFEREMDHVKNYLNLEKLRLEERLLVEFDLEIMDFDIAPLTLQPIVENAVKHGIARKLQGGTIRIATKDAGDKVVILVADDGVGFDREEQDKRIKADSVSHVGMGNVRNRVEQFLQGTMEITSEKGVGTTVTLTISKEWYDEYSSHR